MVWIPGSEFPMGSDDWYPEERPARRARVDGFWIDKTPVTVADFRRFVDVTGYLTLAEQPIDPAAYPDADPELLFPGSAVFTPTSGPVALDSLVWWRYLPGACWHRPEGEESNVDDRADHPVTHIAFEDAQAYADWAGKALPTETEWERAARGGLESTHYAWGNEETPDGKWLANVWQGEFPWQNLALDGYLRTSPVGVFPPNGYGLHDMIGNVWEWTSDEYTTSDQPNSRRPPCCAPAAATTPAVFAMRVIKGGSHLCARNYCHRYRPAARQPQAIDTSTSHLGFRCVIRTTEKPGY
jgi:formylglycine-generating enzyme